MSKQKLRQALTEAIEPLGYEILKLNVPYMSYSAEIEVTIAPIPPSGSGGGLADDWRQPELIPVND